MPEVDVKGGDIDMPKYETTGGKMQLPKYDVKTPDVDVSAGMKEKTIKVPSVDVDVDMPSKGDADEVKEPAGTTMPNREGDTKANDKSGM